jgi:AsmA protein
VKTLFSRRVLIGVGLLILALFLIRPGADRLRGKLSQSISQALGRRVEIESVHLRFLPRPGFEFENLIIFDDAAFGAEPLLRAPDVTAWLRIMPLFRGHIEIATLSLNQASVNLTRDPQGKWNLENLLERTASISTAPTAAEKLESRPAFPYIEATRTRVNFKIGSEKTHFAFTDARFALWQESENSWGMRLKASPIRTDANLTDTGVINVSGMWQRSPVFHETPVQLSFEWKQAQIGQVSRLIYGSDKGWRGSVLLDGALVGTPGKLKFTADASIDDFRRYDVLGGGNLRLIAHCSAEYISLQKVLSDVDCNSSAGDGSLELKGSATGPPFSSYDFSLISSKVPAQAALALLRHSNPSIAEDLDASGSLDATLQLTRDAAGTPQLHGGGEAQDLHLNSASSEIALGRVPFSLGGDVDDTKAHKTRTNRVPNRAPSVSDSQLQIGPMNLVLGRPIPLRAHASLSLSGYQIAVHGDAALKQLLQSARLLGIPVPAVAADGSSTVDLTLADSWTSATPPKVLGTAELRSVQAQVRGLNAPLNIVSASLILSDDSVRVQNLNAIAAQATWHGSMQVTRPCASPSTCQILFNLRTPDLDAADLNALLNPAAAKPSWYKFLSSRGSQPPYLLQAGATGKIAIDKLVLGKSECTQFTADMDLRDGKLSLANVKAQTLGGTTTGELRADFSAHPSAYSGSGSFDGVNLSELAELMHNPWIKGIGAARYEFKASGGMPQDLLASANLTGNFSVRDGSFPHITLTSQPSILRTSNFSGKILLRDGQFSFPEAKLESATGVYKVSGTVSLTGGLNLKMIGESAPGYSLSGTLLKTRVSAIPVTAAQAALKP